MFSNITITECLLSLAQTEVLLGFSIVGLCAWNRKLFLQALGILLFSVFLNSLLKSLTHQHLLGLLGPDADWLFPSGHMHASVAFWGFLAIQLPSLWFRGLIGLGLAGIGWALVAAGFHTWVDVAGGASAALLHLLVRTRLSHKSTGVWLELAILFVLSYAAMLCTELPADISAQKIQLFHICLGALVGLSINQILHEMLQSTSVGRAPHTMPPLISIAMALSGLYWLQQTHWITHPALRGALIATWITSGVHLTLALLEPLLAQLRLTQGRPTH